MTNKELAVQLYATSLQASATMAASPNFHGTVKLPSLEEMATQVEFLTKKLSAIEDN